jgi:uncharacterized protein (DUF433 family)
MYGATHDPIVAHFDSFRKENAAGSGLVLVAAYAGGVTFDRISVDPGRMGGVACIRTLRFPVASVVAMVADGMSNEEILAEHPDLELADISEALRYAALALQERELPLRRPA